MNISNLNKAAILLGRMGDKNKPTQPIIPHKHEKPAFRPLKADTSFKRCAPEEVGISSLSITRFLDTLSSDKSLHMHSIIMSRHGKIFCEATFGTQRLDVHKATFSLCKSVVSLAVGIAIDEGLISHDTRIIDIFHDLCNPIIRMKLKELTVHHLLTMQSGVQFNELECMTDSDWVRSFLRSGTVDMGKKFNYNSLNTYMLAAVLHRVTGMSFKDYLDKKLFAPLNITDYHWEKCPNGIEKGGWGLYISPYDVLKIGTLVLNGGEWNGKQIISEAYITAATSFKVSTPKSCGAFDYGYQMWVGRNSNTFLFNGMFGQNCLGFKDNGVVIVSFAGCDELFQRSSYYSLALDLFDKDLPDKLPSTPKDFKAMLCFIDTLKYTVKKPSLFAKILKRNNDQEKLKKIRDKILTTDTANCIGLLPMVLQAAHNNYSCGLESISFKENKNGFFMEYNEHNAQHTLPLDMTRAMHTELVFDNDSYLVSATCRFAENEYGQTVFLVFLDFLETPCTRCLKFVFEDESIYLRQSESPGKKTVTDLIDNALHTLSGKPIISTVMGKMDKDYILYKTDRVFEPEIKLSIK